MIELALQLDTAADIPLYQQVYEQIRLAILTHRLLAHQRLPASRQLAQSLGVSRTTITQSYDLLISEGYLHTRPGAGTFVCAEVPDDLIHTPAASTAPRNPTASSLPSPLTDRLSHYGHRLQSTADRAFITDCPLSFRYGVPALDHFPLQLWRRLQNRYGTATQSISASRQWMNYSEDPMGYAPLREQIAYSIGQTRAVNCTPEQVMITNGAQQALSLMMQIMINPGDAIALENPGYLSAKRIFSSSGARLVPVAVDAEGLKIDGPDGLSNLSARASHQSLNRDENPAPKLVYVTPSHQFPTGALMSLPRRLALLQWASRHNALIIEDDYDSEFRYRGRPVPALQGLDSEGHVLYVGTFSKTMFPGLRLGYVVLPLPLVPLFRRAKWLSCRQSSLLHQQALTDFMSEGHLAKHIRRMRGIYEGRRRSLIAGLTALTINQSDNQSDAELSPSITAEILGDAAGLHIMARLPTQRSNDDLVACARAQGVSLFSAQPNYCQPSGSKPAHKHTADPLEQPLGKGEFIFGFGDIGESDIQRAIALISPFLLS